MKNCELIAAVVISMVAFTMSGCEKLSDVSAIAEQKNHETTFQEESNISEQPRHSGIFGIVYRPNMAFAVSDESTKICAEDGWKDAYGFISGERDPLPMCWMMSKRTQGVVYLCMVENNRIRESAYTCREFPEYAFVAPSESVTEADPCRFRRFARLDVCGPAG